MFKQLMEQRHISNWESCLMGTDGRVIPVTQNCVLLYNKQQEMIGSVAIIRDNTEKINTENQLRKSHETLLALINAAPESLFLLDIDGTVIIANETLAKRLGPRSMSWLVQTFTNISLMIWPHRAGCLPSRPSATGKWFTMKTCAMIGTWPITTIRFLIKKGDSTRVAVCSWDITERKHAEEELRRHRDHLDERVKDKTAELTIANKQETPEEK